MLLTDARRAARTGPNGELIPLDEQDRTRVGSRRDRRGRRARLRDAVAAGRWPVSAAGGDRRGARRGAARRGHGLAQILALYGVLKRMSDNPMVTLNRAIAAAMVHGPAAGLELLDGAGWRRAHRGPLSARRGARALVREVRRSEPRDHALSRGGGADDKHSRTKLSTHKSCATREQLTKRRSARRAQGQAARNARQRECQTARMPDSANARRRECQTARMPDSAECQTAPNARQRRMPNGVECQRAWNAKGRGMPKGGLRRICRATLATERPIAWCTAVYAHCGIWRCLAFGAVWHSRCLAFAPSGISRRLARRSSAGPAQFGPLRRSGPAPFHASGALLDL